MPKLERNAWWTQNANTSNWKRVGIGWLVWTWLTTSAFAGIDPVAEDYRRLSALLAADEYRATTLFAEQWLRRIEIWLGDENPTEPTLSWVKKIQSGAEKMSKTSDEKKLREFYGEVCAGATRLIKASSLQEKWQLFYCPMVKNYWAQPKAEKMANPYMGLEMLQCGGKKPWTALPEK